MYVSVWGRERERERDSARERERERERESVREREPTPNIDALHVNIKETHPNATVVHHHIITHPDGKNEHAWYSW